MKKVFIFGLSVALVAGSVTSCKKTSTGKVSNEWKTTSWNSSETNTDENGTDVTTVASADGATITVTNTYTPSGGTAGSPNTTSGTINDMSYVINKDGTYSNVQDVTFTATFTGGSVVSNSVSTSTGTWNFLSSNKTEDFKKNERVIFHTLTENSTDTQTVTSGGVTGSPDVTTSASTYATGESSVTFVVVESTGKMLSLMMEEDMTESNTDSNGTSTSSSMSTLEFTLEQK
ncbi:MAG: hypothetical protein ACI8Q1_000605 [Parvicella sp.]|jgi:hypothetical protein